MTKRGVTGFFVGLLFLLVGVAFVWAGIYTQIDNQNFAKNALTAEGTVTNVSSYVSFNNSSSTSNRVPTTYYTPTISFQTSDGKTIISNPGSYPTRYYIGENIEMLYHLDNPNLARIKNQNVVSGLIFFIVFPLVGLFCILMGLLMLFSPLIKSRQDKWLRQYGTTITVPVLRVDPEVSQRGSEPLGFRIVAQWQDGQSQKVYVFKSDILDYDPSSYVTGKQLSVIIDPKNPKKYYIDTASLPKAG